MIAVLKYLLTRNQKITEYIVRQIISFEKTNFYSPFLTKAQDDQNCSQIFNFDLFPIEMLCIIRFLELQESYLHSSLHY